MMNNTKFDGWMIREIDPEDPQDLDFQDSFVVAVKGTGWPVECQTCGEYPDYLLNSEGRPSYTCEGCLQASFDNRAEKGLVFYGPRQKMG